MTGTLCHIQCAGQGNPMILSRPVTGPTERQTVTGVTYLDCTLPETEQNLFGSEIPEETSSSKHGPVLLY